MRYHLLNLIEKSKSYFLKRMTWKIYTLDSNPKVENKITYVKRNSSPQVNNYQLTLVWKTKAHKLEKISVTIEESQD